MPRGLRAWQRPWRKRPARAGEKANHAEVMNNPTPEIPPEARGLSESEAQARRAAGQGNPPPAPTSRTYFQIVRENVFTFVNDVIFVLGVALWLIGRPADALVSVGIISLNILVSVVQEVRAKRTLDRIALLTRPQATVVRDGAAHQVPPEELVLGDVLYVAPGDQIVLDGEVVRGKMTVDESPLTGESDPVEKRPGDEVYSGSFCATGSAFYTAQKVGAASFANEITAGARAFRRILTPLQQEVALTVRIMLFVVVYLEFLIVLHTLLLGVDLGDTVQHSTLVAGLIPNGLFLSISVAYALGAVRIVRFGVLVQQANAIESLSNVDLLCLDKTGTLTTNQLVFEDLYPLDGVKKDELGHVLGLMMANSSVQNKTGAAIAQKFPGEKRAVMGEIPFSAARKWSAIALADGAERKSAGVFALGASEMLQPYLADVEDLDDSPVWREIAIETRRRAEQGLRVLLVARAPGGELKDEGDGSRLPEGMTPLGLVSIRDELRPEAREAIEAFRRAGVTPKIISGDNPETVAALARQAGLEDCAPVSGLELEKLDDAAFADTARRATVFGRITPRQKERLIRVLRADGNYVAMIGDGVNDVLSLKQANLGIAMQSGTQAARAVADLVLMEDSFGALAPAVGEGQRIVNGMQDILKLFMTRIVTMAVVIISALVVGVFPLELRQGSLVTLFSVGIPTVALAIWARPGPTAAGTLGRRLFHFVLTPVVTTTVLALLVFFAMLVGGTLLGNDIGPREATPLLVAESTLVIFMVFAGLLTVIFVEPPTAWWAGADEVSGDWKPTILVGALFVVFFVILAWRPLRELFVLAPIGPVELGVAGAAALVWLFLVRWLWREKVFERFLGVKGLVER